MGSTDYMVDVVSKLKDAKSRYDVAVAEAEIIRLSIKIDVPGWEVVPHLHIGGNCVFTAWRAGQMQEGLNALLSTTGVLNRGRYTSEELEVVTKALKEYDKC